MRTSTLRLLALAVLVVTVSSQPVFLLGAASIRIGPELGFGPFGLGVLTATFFLTASLTSAPLGRWVQRVGWQQAMRVNLVVAASVLVAVALAARSIWSLAALLVIGAACYGMSNPAANLLLAEHTDPRWQATVFGVKHAGIPSSTLLAGLAVPVVVLNAGWRWAFAGSAALAGLVLLLIPRGPVPPRSFSDPPPASRGTSTLGVGSLIWLALGASAATWGAIALGAFGTSAAIDAGLSEAAAGWLLFGGSLTSIGARLGAGYLTDRRESRGFAGIVLLAGLGAIVFALLPLVEGAAFAALVVVAFATAWGWPGLMTYSVVNANRTSVASSSAITQAGVFVGAGAGPLILGLLIERGSFAAAWVTVAGMLLVAVGVVIGVARRARVNAAAR